MKRADRGIYKLAPDLYRVIVSGGIDPARTAKAGRPVYRQIERQFSGSLTKAREFRASLIVEARHGRYGGTDATVSDLLDAWLRELERIGRSPATVMNYRKDTARNVRPIFGHLKVRDVTARMLADHYGALIESGLAPNSVRLVHAAMSSAFSQAMRWEWIDKDPTKLVRAPALANKRPVIPTVADVSALLNAAKRSTRPEMAVAIWLSATTGIRRGELCGLQLSDFDLDRGRMVIERAISGETVGTTKNRRWREVALDPATVLVIEAHIAMLRARAGDAGASVPDDGYLFSDHPRCAEPWNPHTVTDAFRKLTGDLDLRHLTFHSLRKFMESRALDLGFSIPEVAHRAGHDPSVLLKFYAGAVDESGVRLAEAVASLLSGQ